MKLTPESVMPPRLRQNSAISQSRMSTRSHGHHRSDEKIPASRLQVNALLFFLLCAALCAAQPVSIVTDGCSDFEIVLPTKANIIHETAGNELQYHIEKASGAKLAIVSLKKHASGKPAIFLGAPPATHAVDYPKPNGFALQLVGKDIYIYGDDRPAGFARRSTATRYGTLFGAYEFLERAVGCRWLWPGDLGEYIPKNANIAWDGETVSKTLPFQKNNYRYNTLKGNLGNAWKSAENQKKFNQAIQLFFLRNRMVTSMVFNAGHSFTQYYATYAKDHPDWFNQLPDGTRRPDPFYGSKSTIAMCVSNEGLQDNIVQRYLNLPAGMLPCIENDTDAKCTCPKCLAWDEPDPVHPELFETRLARATEAFKNGNRAWHAELGSASDRYARFYNACLRKAKAVRPDAQLICYFYANYRLPPVKTKLEPGVIGGVVPDLTFPWFPRLRQEFRTMWDGWAAAGAQMYLRPNYTLEGHNFPIWYADAFLDDFIFAARRGLIGTDFDALTGQFSTQGLNVYAVVRAHYHYDLGKDAILGEYYKAFGAAEPAIRSYFMHWKAISDAVDYNPHAAFSELKYAGFAKFYLSGPRIFQQDAFDRGFQLLAQASASVPSDSIEARRIQYLKNGLRNAELTVEAQRIKNEKGGTAPEFIAKVQELDEYRAAIEGDLGCDFNFLHFCENRTWDRTSIRLMATAGCPIKADWQIWFDEMNTGDQDGVFKPQSTIGNWKPIQVGETYERQPAHVEWKNAHENRSFNGICWYRATFTAAPGKDAILTFGAVDEACKVYVNGTCLLDRPYPYKGNSKSWDMPFSITIPATLLNQTNDLCVKVINNAGPGGIFKQVFLK